MAVAAQDYEAQKKEINQVKKSPDKYLYVEIIDSLESLALSKAQHALQDDIDDYAKAQKNLKNASKIIARNVKTQSITMPRGNNCYRAFAYVKKTDIIPADNVMVNDNAPAVKKSAATPVSIKDGDTIARLTALQKVSDIIPTLQQLKAEGRIAGYAKIKELKGEASDYVLLVCSREGKVEAVLSQGTQRTNLRTGQPDDMYNYKGRAFLCVKVNQ